MQRKIITKHYQKIVIKIGTSLLCDANAKDSINHKVLKNLRDDILFLRKEGKQVILVSSGAVQIGRSILKKYGISEKETSSRISQRQALAALGQNALMNAYQKIMEESNLPVAQLLLTAMDFQNRRSYLNIQHTTQELLRLGVLAIANENDTVATDELQFGENDLLSAAFSALLGSELLIILTSVEGFLLKGKCLSYVDNISPEHWRAARGSHGPGRGGMHAKLRAAQLCNMSGIHCVMLPGQIRHPIRSFFSNQDIGSLFASKQSHRLSARKKWLLFSCARGVVIVDPGARKALENVGSSLLPMGVQKLQGQFLPDEIVEIKDEKGFLIGRGLINYSYKEISAMIGLSLQEMNKRNLLQRSKELIHRDNFVLETGTTFAHASKD